MDGRRARGGSLSRSFLDAFRSETDFFFLSFTQRLQERGWFAITETLLALTIFREEFESSFVMLFVSLLFFKVFHWLASDRVEMVRPSPFPFLVARLIETLEIDGTNRPSLAPSTCSHDRSPFCPLARRHWPSRLRRRLDPVGGSHRDDHVRFRGAFCLFSLSNSCWESSRHE
jgi:hypothetical protein